MDIEQVEPGERYAYTRGQWGSVGDGYEIVEALGFEAEPVHQHGRDVLMERVRIRFTDGSEQLTNPKWLFGTVEETELEIARRTDESRRREIQHRLFVAEAERDWHDKTATERQLNAQARVLAGRLRAVGFELTEDEIPDFVADRRSRENAEEDYEACHHSELHTTFRLSAERMAELLQVLESKEAAKVDASAAS